MTTQARTTITLDQTDGEGKGYRLMTATATEGSDQVEVTNLEGELTCEQAIRAAGVLQALADFAKDRRTLREKMQQAADEAMAEASAADVLPPRATKDAPASTLGYHGASRVDEQGEDLWADA